MGSVVPKRLAYFGKNSGRFALPRGYWSFVGLLPSNASSAQVWAPGGTNRIPAYSDSFMDTSRLFIQPKYTNMTRNVATPATANAKLANRTGAIFSL